MKPHNIMKCLIQKSVCFYYNCSMKSIDNPNLGKNKILLKFETLYREKQK